jgi:Fe-S cluster assembly protein SufD
MGMLNQFTTPLYNKLIAEFENSGKDTTGGLSAIRKNAFEHFKAKGFPTTKDEDWKFTNLTPFLADDFSFNPAVPEEESVRKMVSDALVPDLDAYCLIILNGSIQFGLSVLPAAHEVTVRSLKEISEQPVFGQYANLNGDDVASSMTALNTALFKDGYFLQVHKGITLDKPIQVVNIYTAAENILFQPRNLVIVEPGAKAELIDTTVVEKHTNLLFVNSVSHVVVKENAQLVQYRIQDNASDERLLQYNHVTQERSSRYDNFTFCLPGADLIRNNLHVVLDGTATETHLLGLYLVGEHQLTDNHTAIHHKHPHCESNEIYKGVLLDNGKAVFNGKVFVEREAQKTNAFQQNNNLLLSDKAQVFAKPQLEIFADDVKCSHGCTVGQFDPESLFYLRSRGISEDSSRKLLIEAFMFDVTQKIENEPLKRYVQNLIYSKMENSFASIA